jgi:hypothetical protein
LDEKPDFSTLLSYGNESVMLDKLIAETEKGKGWVAPCRCPDGRNPAAC